MASWLLQYWLQCGYPSKESEVQKQISNADRFVHLNCIIFHRSVRIMKIRQGYKYHFSLVLLPQSTLCTDLLRQIFSQVKSTKDGKQICSVNQLAQVLRQHLTWTDIFPTQLCEITLKTRSIQLSCFDFAILDFSASVSLFALLPYAYTYNCICCIFLFFLPCASDFEWVAAVFWDTWPVMSLEKLQHCFAECCMFWLPLPFITVVQFHGY